nr:MAG TPA: hypothetical protein [Caudoviricetes sp.]
MCQDNLYLGNSLNCWKLLKLKILQRNFEIQISVNVAKAEKNFKIRYG